MRDYRYDSTKVLIETGHVKSFRELFDHVPKTTVYKDLHVNFNRFSGAIHYPAVLTMDEMFKLADLFGVDRKLIVDMAFQASNNKHPMKQKK